MTAFATKLPPKMRGAEIGADAPARAGRISLERAVRNGEAITMNIRSSAKTHGECLRGPARELCAGIPPRQTVADRLRSRIGAGLQAIVDTLFAWQQRRADRLRLQRMDDRMLKDMGLSRADIETEIHKPFWRP